MQPSLRRCLGTHRIHCMYCLLQLQPNSLWPWGRARKDFVGYACTILPLSLLAVGTYITAYKIILFLWATLFKFALLWSPTHTLYTIRWRFTAFWPSKRGLTTSIDTCRPSLLKKCVHDCAREWQTICMLIDTINWDTVSCRSAVFEEEVQTLYRVQFMLLIRVGWYGPQGRSIQ